MPSHRSHRSPQAAISTGGGCLSGFLLPPLAVVVIGAIMAFFLPGVQVLPAAASVNTWSIDLDQPDSSAQPTSPSQPAGLSPIFTPEVDFWASDIQRWAAAAGLDPNLAATVMQIESCGDPQALSRAGAMSLFQVMPFHFVAGEDPFDPDTNALRGMGYLQRSLQAAGGNPRLALAGYNGGIGVISWSESSWPAETQRYAYWGSGIYAEASGGSTESQRLQEWLTTSGLSLCRQAARRLGLAQ